MSKHQDETKNKKEKQANGLTTKLSKNKRTHNKNMQSETTESKADVVSNDKTAEEPEDDQQNSR